MDVSENNPQETILGASPSVWTIDPRAQVQDQEDTTEDPHVFMKDPKIITAMDNIVDAEGALDSAKDTYEIHV
jgi:hypothetical protein